MKNSTTDTAIKDIYPFLIFTKEPIETDKPFFYTSSKDKLVYTARSIFSDKFRELISTTLPSLEKFLSKKINERREVEQLLFKLLEDESVWKSLVRKTAHDNSAIHNLFSDSLAIYKEKFVLFFPKGDSKRDTKKYPSQKSVNYLEGLGHFLIDQKVIELKKGKFLSQVDFNTIVKTIDAETVFLSLVKLCMRETYESTVKQDSLHGFTINDVDHLKDNPNLRAKRSAVHYQTEVMFRNYLLTLFLQYLSEEEFIPQKSDEALLDLIHYVDSFFKYNRSEIMNKSWYENIHHAAFGILTILEQTPFISSVLTSVSKKSRGSIQEHIIYQFSQELEHTVDFSQHLPKITPPLKKTTYKNINSFIGPRKAGSFFVRASKDTIQALNLSQRKCFKINHSFLDILKELDRADGQQHLSPIPTGKSFADQTIELDIWETCPLLTLQKSFTFKYINNFLKARKPDFIYSKDNTKSQNVRKRYDTVSFITDFTSSHQQAFQKVKSLREKTLADRARRQIYLTSLDIADLFSGFPLYYSTKADYRLRMYPLEYLLSRTSGSLRRTLEDFKDIKLTQTGLIYMLKAYYNFDDKLSIAFKHFLDTTELQEKSAKTLLGDYFLNNKVVCGNEQYPYVKMLELELSSVFNSTTIMKTAKLVEIDQNASGLVLSALLFKNKGLAEATNLICEDGSKKDIYLLLRDKIRDFFDNDFYKTYVNTNESDTDLQIFYKVRTFFVDDPHARKVHKSALMKFGYNQGNYGRTEDWLAMYSDIHKVPVVPQEVVLFHKISAAYTDIIDKTFPKYVKQRDLINNAVELVVKNENSDVSISTLDGSLLSWDFSPVLSKSKQMYNPIKGQHEPISLILTPSSEKEKSSAARKRINDHIRCFMPNLIQSIDGALMRKIILGVYAHDKYIINHLHDCILLHPSKVPTLMKTLTQIYTSINMNTLSDDLVFDPLRSKLDSTGKLELDKIQGEFNSLKDDFALNSNNFDPWNIYSFEK